MGGALSKGTAWHLVMETHYKVLQASALNGKPRTPVQTKRALAACRKAVEPLFRDEETGEQTEVQALIEMGTFGSMASTRTGRSSLLNTISLFRCGTRPVRSQVTT